MRNSLKVIKLNFYKKNTLILISVSYIIKF